ncbi:hypothetical protein ACCM60_14455 [Pseudomonas chlororaphis subsp. aureofaciens]|uniref:hypothetical protein n=1 Tax=Pseudomonas chlororaphis TaxID=587753 RepID=UPI003556D8D8
MTWLRAGTVAVTNGSTTVTGTGTGFAANTRVGDAFIGPDGRQYELANVASDTVISITPAYQGSTDSGAPYAIMPVQGYQKGLADQVRDWVNTYGSKMAALGTTGNYDILPADKGGTGRTSVGTAVASDVTTGSTDSTAGRLLKVGDFGVGSKSPAATENLNLIPAAGQYIVTPSSVGGGIADGGYGTLIQCAYDIASANWTQLIMRTDSNRAFMRVCINGQPAPTAEFYTTANTTRAADGTLKAI